MAATTPTKEPTSVRAGDTWAWRREDLSDYPASVWTLTYYFRNADYHFDVAATADVDAFAISVPAATTAPYPAGTFDWMAVVTYGTDRYQIGSGVLRVLPDLSVAANYDARSFARQMLDAVEAALLSKASAQQMDLIKAQLEARSVEYSPANLISLRSRLLTEVKREESIANGTDVRRVMVRFS